MGLNVWKLAAEVVSSTAEVDVVAPSPDIMLPWNDDVGVVACDPTVIDGDDPAAAGKDIMFCSSSIVSGLRGLDEI